MNLRHAASFTVAVAAICAVATLPAQASNLLLGASLGGGVNDQARIQQFQSLTGHKVDIVSVPMPWAGPAGFISFNGSLLQWAKQVSAYGAIPMVSWEPETWNGASSPAPGACPNQLAHEAESAPAIQFIHRYARDVAAFGRPIWLRPMHEMNMSGWEWSVGNNPACGYVSAADFIAAWRRLVGIFRQESAHNAKFIWCVNWSSIGTLPGPVTVTYPGDAYVDYAAIDGYNFGGDHWHSFDQIFRVPYAAIAAQTRRPILIAEWASAEAGGSKARWIRSAFSSVGADHYPRLAGLVWFNETPPGQPPWPISSSPAAAQAYRAAVSELH